jgi:hypothetical protein
MRVWGTRWEDSKVPPFFRNCGPVHSATGLEFRCIRDTAVAARLVGVLSREGGEHGDIFGTPRA